EGPGTRRTIPGGTRVHRIGNRRCSETRVLARVQDPAALPAADQTGPGADFLARRRRKGDPAGAAGIILHFGDGQAPWAFAQRSVELQVLRADALFGSFSFLGMLVQQYRQCLALLPTARRAPP